MRERKMREPDPPWKQEAPEEWQIEYEQMCDEVCGVLNGYVEHEIDAEANARLALKILKDYLRIRD